VNFRAWTATARVSVSARQLQNSLRKTSSNVSHYYTLFAQTLIIWHSAVAVWRRLDGGVPIIGMPPADRERSNGQMSIADRSRHADSGPLTCCLLGFGLWMKCVLHKDMWLLTCWQRTLKSIKTLATSGTRYAEPDNSKCDSQLQQLCRLRTYCVLGWLQELQQEYWTGLLVVWSSQISCLGSTGPGSAPASQAYVERFRRRGLAGDD